MTFTPPLFSVALTATLLFSANAGAANNSPPVPEAWPDEGLVVEISAATRASRATIIRDTAAAAGLTNAVLLAGIGEVETNFAHCWSEATWACKGPASSSCNGGPVIAGSADGACSLKQGGLGLFQFDAGTHSQTIATYGPDVVTMSGNVGEVVPFLVERAIQSVEGVDTEQQALDWMNSIPVVDGDPKFEEWLFFIAWRFNGCKGCTSQQNKYRNGTHALLAEMGADFWNGTQVPEPQASCGTIPADGTVIEEDDDCYEAGGPAEFWRHENAGHGGTSSWTVATASASTSNFGVWNLHFDAAGHYRVEIFTDDGEFGQSRQASYEVSHAEGRSIITIDQSAVSGWTALGTFEFEAGQPFSVRLDDNTGEPWQPAPDGVKLIFDALRVQPASADSTGDPSPGGGLPNETRGELLIGGCSTAASDPSAPWLLPLLALLLIRRRRQTAR